MRITKNRSVAITAAMLVGMLAGAGALAQVAPTRVEGEVVQIMQQTRAGEPGGLDAVMIRTREGEQVRLLLGESGSCVGCVQLGDQVRARLSKNGTAMNGYQVRSMKVERTGEKLQFRTASGDLVRTRTHDRINDGTGMSGAARDRDRIHQPGTGTGTGGGGTKGGGRR